MPPRGGEHLGVTGLVPTNAPARQPHAVELSEFFQRHLARADALPEVYAIAHDGLLGILAGADPERIAPPGAAVDQHGVVDDMRILEFFAQLRLVPEIDDGDHDSLP